jgi:GAF domain-containing protein
MPRALAVRLSRLLVGCYPRHWRERYGDEMLEVLGQCQPTARTVLSLWTGAVSAHLSPGPRRTQLPGVVPGWVTDATDEPPTGPVEVGALLQYVAGMLVPQFADHCCIDLFQGKALIRQVQCNADGWTPPAGAWAQAGEEIRYPQGHFCQQAMTRLDTIIVTGLDKDRGERYPPPSAGSFAAAKQAGITSALAAPLHARGVVFGVLSLARSGLTPRAEPNYAATDRDLFSAVAGQVATAIDKALIVRGRAPGRARPAAQRTLCRQEETARCTGRSLMPGKDAFRPGRDNTLSVWDFPFVSS